MIIPKGIDFELWARQLNIDFPNDEIPIPLQGEKEFKTWGESLVQRPSFAKNNAPIPKDDEKFEDWAMKIYTIMNEKEKK